MSEVLDQQGTETPASETASVTETEPVSPPAQERQQPAEQELEPGSHSRRRKQPLYRRPAVVIAAALVLLVGAILLVRYWLYARSHESTDDAFIDGHITQISPKISGYISKVYITDNQQVKAGDLLVEIDSRDFEARLAQAKAALDAGLARLKQARTSVELTRRSTSANVQQASATVEQARSGVVSSRAAASSERSRVTQARAAVTTAEANLAQARSQEVAAEAEAIRANADIQRYQDLYAKDEVSRQRLDQAVATARTATAQLDAARGKVASAAAQVGEARAAEAAASETARRAQSEVGGAQAQVKEAQGRLAQANTAPQQVAVSQAEAETAGASIEELRAQVEQAELQLSYAKIYAPVAGRVTRKSVEVGSLVDVSQVLMALVLDDVWVTANFKENQIGRMQPGQYAEITVDAYPGKVFRAHVDSIQAGTGARFSLLPPENATGNYVKVVQRVPVKIVFDEPPDPQHLLAPGMSVLPEVKVK